MDEATFRTEIAAAGCKEFKTVEWEAGRANPEQAHDFNAHGFILRGEFTLTTADWSRCLKAGDTFALTAGTAHTETTGPQGVEILSGRVYLN